MYLYKTAVCPVFDQLLLEINGFLERSWKKQQSSPCCFSPRLKEFVEMERSLKVKNNLYLLHSWIGKYLYWLQLFAQVSVLSPSLGRAPYRKLTVFFFLRLKSSLSHKNVFKTKQSISVNTRQRVPRESGCQAEVHLLPSKERSPWAGFKTVWGDRHLPQVHTWHSCTSVLWSPSTEAT